MAAVCLALSLCLHAIGAVVLSVFPFGAVTPPIASVDTGAHSISVMIVPPAPTPEPTPPVVESIQQPPAPTPIEPTPPTPLTRTLNEIILTITAPPEQERPRDSRTSNIVIPPPRPAILTPELAVDAPSAQDAPPPTEPIETKPVIEVVTAASDADDAGASTGVKIIGDIAPKYPSRSRRLGEQGLVLLDVHVLPTGKAGDIRVRQNPGHRRLVNAAIDAVRTAKFTPATRNDKPVAAWLNVPVRFVIE